MYSNEIIKKHDFLKNHGRNPLSFSSINGLGISYHLKHKKKLFKMQNIFYLVVLFSIGINANPLLRVYENPLNNKQVDLFFVVDEANANMNQLELGQIKLAIIDAATELQPSGSSPYFGVYFYGAKTSVEAVVPFPTTSAATMKSKLDLKQYSVGQSSPSTLSSALQLVRSACGSTSARSNVPRVAVIFTANPYVLAESYVRELESSYGMTVIAVGIGPLALVSSLQKISSHPSATYVMSFNAYSDVVSSARYISGVVSNVPPALTRGSTLSISSTTNGVLYSVQLNTAGHINNNETLVTYTTNCHFCTVYISLGYPNPSSANANQNTDRKYIYTSSGTYYDTYYFRIPKSTNRLFLSFVANGASSITGVFDTLAIPQILQ